MINETRISLEKYSEILNLFPIAWHDRLRIYTGEELFYVYRLCKFKPAKDLDAESCVDHKRRFCRDCAFFKVGDITFAAIRARMIRYLKGQLDEYGRIQRPVPVPAAWGKLGRRFKHAWLEHIGEQPTVEMADVESLEKLKAKINGARVA